MTIAIHHRRGSFSDRWIEYCEKNGIDYKIVNAYDSNIIEQVENCDIFMWHHHHANYKDVLFSKQLLFSLQQSGKKVFPDFNTNWHFDDKVGQKYLLESIGAPLVPSYAFYSKKEAICWANEATFPKVFKLRGGAGSLNVQLVESREKAKGLIERAFGKGFKSVDRNLILKDRFAKLKNKQLQVNSFIKYFLRDYFFSLQNFSYEKGYVYFQDFIPNNTSDLRIIVIEDKAFAIKRLIRKNDFRASGGGEIIYLDNQTIDKGALNIAFETAVKLKSQCVAFDFVFSENRALIVEISYGFSMNAYDDCLGYWNSNMDFIKEKIHPQEWILKNLLK